MTDLEGMIEAFEAAGGIKDKMRAKGIRHGRCKCPSCGKPECEAALAGPKDHLRLRCRACGYMMME